MTERCANPPCYRDAQVAGYCTPDYRYVRKHGHPRSTEQIIASARRRMMIDERRARERRLAAVGMVEQWAQPKGMSA